MSDTPKGPGWWQASDGQWYPPEQHPAARPEHGRDVPPEPGFYLARDGIWYPPSGPGQRRLTGPQDPSGGDFPARLDGQLDSDLSRWLWVVKWVLVVPHVVVLIGLWLAVLPVTVAAGLSILFTGKYPRGLFDFTVGVIRWTWRVSFYAYSALGTDRYPPFSLSPEPGYPADFGVDYPDHLSRGLVLVKWWLLAIPQYVVVGFLAGGWSTTLGSRSWTSTGGGLIGILVLIAAVTLAVTTRYPRQLFDFVMGLDRWCFRVLTYVLLLRDEYPPFRFDGGGTDPGTRANGSPRGQ